MPKRAITTNFSRNLHLSTRKAIIYSKAIVLHQFNTWPWWKTGRNRILFYNDSIPLEAKIVFCHRPQQIFRIPITNRFQSSPIKRLNCPFITMLGISQAAKCCKSIDNTLVRFYRVAYTEHNSSNRLLMMSSVNKNDL